jgi:TonB-linked SusC/RagA family outer membrane protein
LAVFAGAAHAQGTVVTGTVKSEQGQPLEGANVIITELNVSVGTNASGAFRIALAPERAHGQQVMLRVRAIGFQPDAKQITLSAGNVTQDFSLKIDVNRLSEVVVTGVTGATETKKLAFTVTKVDESDLPVPAATNALQGLQGKVTGAQIVMPSGRPGDSPAILLRGAKSINLSSTPLIIVDGVLLNGSLTDLNPEDIESMEVVKGAAASSTYGSRAQNGVIQITTKSGKNAQAGARFNVRSEYGYSDVQSEYPGAQRTTLMIDESGTRICVQTAGQPTCSRSIDFAQETYRVNNYSADGFSALTPPNFERDFGIGLAPSSKSLLKGLFQITQWPVRYNPMAQVVTDNPYNTTNVDLSGRFNNTNYFASVNTTLQSGAIRFLDGYNRQSARLNVGQQITDELSADLQTFYSRSILYPSLDFFRVTRVPAGVNLLRRDSKGSLFIRSDILNQGQQNENPLYNAENNEQRTNADRYLGSFNTRYTPFSWLEFTSNASLDRRRQDQYSLTDKGFHVTSVSQSQAYLGSLDLQDNSAASYNFSFGGTARQNNLLGVRDLQTRLNASYSFERTDNNSLRGRGSSLAVPGLLSLANVTVPNQPSSSYQSIRAIGFLTGIAADYKGKYIADATFRRDGSSLFGAAERWHPYYRGSFAWRVSDESFWPFKGAINDLKLRTSVGTAGGRPNFDYQYETFNIGTGGAISANQLGNRFLKPENTLETEYGIDGELFGKYGINLTYARDITSDVILPVPSSASSGFATQWKNAARLDNNTYEASINVPFITNKTVVWTGRFSYDRNRTHITALYVPNFSLTNNSERFEYRNGERIGQVWGKYFLRACDQLPTPFASDCGSSTSNYQVNDEGYVVWTGGLSPAQGLTNNAWQAALPGCLVNGVAVNQTGNHNCVAAGGTPNNPWAIPFLHWGMHIALRDTTGGEIYAKEGNTSPDFRLSFSQNLQYKKLTFYALVDGNYGTRLFNEEIHWSLGDFMVRYEDQDGKTPATAKPLGYYWRATSPENGAGVGGFYDVLGSNNQTVEKATYTKLREVNVSYQIGPVRGIGDWSVSLVGRNLWTITDYLGWDPETGAAGAGPVNSDAVGNVAAYQYPQTRSFSLALQTRF